LAIARKRRTIWRLLAPHARISLIENLKETLPSYRQEELKPPR
jgi:hypothetical protein